MIFVFWYLPKSSDFSNKLSQYAFADLPTLPVVPGDSRFFPFSPGPPTKSWNIPVFQEKSECQTKLLGSIFFIYITLTLRLTCLCTIPIKTDHILLFTLRGVWARITCFCTGLPSALSLIQYWQVKAGFPPPILHLFHSFSNEMGQFIKSPVFLLNLQVFCSSPPGFYLPGVGKSAFERKSNVNE